MGTSARKARIWFNGYDLSNYFTTWSAPQKLETDKTGAFTDDDETHVATIGSSTLQCSGLGFWAAGSINEVLDAAFATKVDQTLTLAPFGETIGNFAYLMAPLQSDWVPADSKYDKVVKTQAQWTCDGPIDDGVVVNDLTSFTVAQSTGAASVNNGAATSNGGVFQAHATAGTFTAATLELQHSTNNSTFTVLATLSFTGPNQVQRTVIAPGTTVNQYVDTLLSALTGTNVIVPAAFARR